MSWKRDDEPPVEAIQLLENGFLSISFYDTESGVQRIEVVVEGGIVPVTLGSTFTCRVVAVERTMREGIAR
jgi:hypothetical protein